MGLRYIQREEEKGASERWFFTTSAKVLPSFKLHLFAFPHVHRFFSINIILQHTSIAFTLHKNGFSNKKQTKLYKFNIRPKTMVRIPLNWHVRAIFQSEKDQNILIIIALIYRAKMEQ